MINIYEAQSANKRKSFIIVLLFAIFVALTTYILASAFGVYMGYEPGGLGVAGLALIVSSLSSFIGYYFSDKIVLTISEAKIATRNKYFNYYSAVENLSIGAGIPMPKLYVLEDSAPNAFACGRNPENSAICATTGLLEKLNRSELEGVMAHEISHIRNYDSRLQTIVAVLVGLIALLGDWFLSAGYHGRRSDDEVGKSGALILLLGFVFALLSPFVAQIIRLAISRRREFFADASSVAITKQPDGLISALKILSRDREPLEAANKATAHLYVVSPFKTKTGSGVGRFASLFNTHPPLEERIKALEKMQ